MSYTNKQIAQQIADVLNKSKKQVFQKGTTSNTGVNKEIYVNVNGEVIRALGWNVATPGKVNVFWDSQNKRYVAFKEETSSLKRNTILSNRKTRPNDKLHVWEYFIKVLQPNSIEGFDDDLTLIDLSTSATIAGFKNTGLSFELLAYKIVNDNLQIYIQNSINKNTFTTRVINKDFFTNNIIPNPTLSDEKSIIYFYTTLNNPWVITTNSQPDIPPNTSTYSVFYNNPVNSNIYFFAYNTPLIIPETYIISRIPNNNLVPPPPEDFYGFDLRTTVSFTNNSNITQTLSPENPYDNTIISNANQQCNHVITEGSTTIGATEINSDYRPLDYIKVVNLSNLVTANLTIENESSFIKVNPNNEEKIIFTTEKSSDYAFDFNYDYDESNTITILNGVDNINYKDTLNSNYNYIRTYFDSTPQNFTFILNGINVVFKEYYSKTKQETYLLTRLYDNENHTYGDGYRTYYGWYYYSSSYHLQTEKTIMNSTENVTDIEDIVKPYIQLNNEIITYVFSSIKKTSIDIAHVNNQDNDRYIVYDDYDIWEPSKTIDDNVVVVQNSTLTTINYNYITLTHKANIKVGNTIFEKDDTNIGYYVIFSNYNICSNLKNLYSTNPENVNFIFNINSFGLFYGVDLSNSQNHLTHQPKENVTKLSREIDSFTIYEGNGSTYNYTDFVTVVRNENVITTDKNINALSNYPFITGEITLHFKYEDKYYICDGIVVNKTFNETPNVFETVMTKIQTAYVVSYKTSRIIVSGLQIQITNIVEESFNGLVENNNDLLVVPKNDYTRVLLPKLYQKNLNINSYSFINAGNETVEIAITEIPTTINPETLRVDIYQFNTTSLKWERKPNVTSPVSPLTDVSDYLSYHPTPSNKRKKKKRPPSL